MSRRMDRDPYRVLKVDRDATAEEIGRAWRLLALRVHPDKNRGATKEVEKKNTEQLEKYRKAYALIGTEAARDAYDKRHPPRGAAASVASAAQTADDEERKWALHDKAKLLLTMLLLVAICSSLMLVLSMGCAVAATGCIFLVAATTPVQPLSASSTLLLACAACAACAVRACIGTESVQWDARGDTTAVVFFFANASFMWFFVIQQGFPSILWFLRYTNSAASVRLCPPDKQGAFAAHERAFGELVRTKCQQLHGQYDAHAAALRPRWEALDPLNIRKKGSVRSERSVQGLVQGMFNVLLPIFVLALLGYVNSIFVKMAHDLAFLQPCVRPLQAVLCVSSCFLVRRVYTRTIPPRFRDFFRWLRGSPFDDEADALHAQLSSSCAQGVTKWLFVLLVLFRAPLPTSTRALTALAVGTWLSVLSCYALHTQCELNPRPGVSAAVTLFASLIASGVQADATIPVAAVAALAILWRLRSRSRRRALSAVCASVLVL